MKRKGSMSNMSLMGPLPEAKKPKNIHKFDVSNTTLKIQKLQESKDNDEVIIIKSQKTYL